MLTLKIVENGVIAEIGERTFIFTDVKALGQFVNTLQQNATKKPFTEEEVSKEEKDALLKKD